MTSKKTAPKHPPAERIYQLTEDEREKLERAATLKGQSKSEYMKDVVMAQVERDLADAAFAVGEGQGPGREIDRWRSRLHDAVDALARELVRVPRPGSEKS